MRSDINRFMAGLTTREVRGDIELVFCCFGHLSLGVELSSQSHSQSSQVVMEFGSKIPVTKVNFADC